MISTTHNLTREDISEVYMCVYIYMIMTAEPCSDKVEKVNSEM